MNIMKRIRSTQEGFTLIELLIVIVILGVLAAIIVPRMTNLTERARVSAGESSLRSVYNGLEMFRVEYGRYPDRDTDGDIGDSVYSFADVIENFDGLDKFLGEWTYTGTDDGYDVTADYKSFTITVQHGSDSSLVLVLNSDGTITTP